MITLIILTYNEELHLQRCLESVKNLAERIIIVDSFSTDKTCEIAQQFGAEVIQRKFVNQAEQFQWALENTNISTEWVFRLDADEYVLPELYQEIKEKLNHLPQEITGINLKRRLYFQSSWIKRGGFYPLRLLRIWRNGAAVMEQKMMDEHTVLMHGKSIDFDHDFVDENLSSLVKWTEKHNNYSTREAIMRLDAQYHFLEQNQQNLHKSNKQFYLKLPLFLRAFVYFCYRYFIKLGLLDGRNGLIWHVLQGFWYQFLVDAKIAQVEYFSKKENKPMKTIIEEKLNFKF
ncbi:glycosyltransferase family 2 protein [Cloacibacterium normanense]|uniref:glycosyltransferase family 2 protein n=1 Tax=Cloacibacterium normanense TaxID=237258 RepID=UPI00352DE4AA